MRKIKEVPRLKWEQRLSNRAIARSCSIGRATVGEYLRRAAAAGLRWPLPEELDEAELERKLFPPPPLIPIELRPTPNWPETRQELQRKGMTLFLLWEEYRQSHPDGFQYSWFCQHYSLWAEKLGLVMRQSHRAGEKLFADYAGQTVPVINPANGEIREAQIFLAVLGASNYTYAEAAWTQQLPDWMAGWRGISNWGGKFQFMATESGLYLVFRGQNRQAVFLNMARAKRHYIPGYIWHITHRCHKREILLKFAGDRHRYLQWLYEARKRYGLTILNYMVASNHIHLLVADDGDRDGIPNSMQLVAGRTGQEYNQRKDRRGATGKIVIMQPL